MAPLNLIFSSSLHFSLASAVAERGSSVGPCSKLHGFNVLTMRMYYTFGRAMFDPRKVW